MMQEVNTKTHMVVDRSSFAEVAGAQQADLDANSVVVKRQKGDGTNETVTLYWPAGIAIVRRR